MYSPKQTDRPQADRQADRKHRSIRQTDKQLYSVSLRVQKGRTGTFLKRRKKF